MKTTLSALAIFTSLIFSQTASADTFCGSRTSITYGGGETRTGDLTGN